MADVELSTLGSVIKTAYESQANTNAFTDAEQTKLTGVATGATVGVNTQDDAVGVVTDSTTLNFAGAGVVVTDAGGGVSTITIAGGGGSAITVEDEGVPLTTGVTKFNFAGAGVTVTEPIADEMLVTIPGGGSIPTQDDGVQIVAAPTAHNFVGSGVVVTDVGGVSTITIANPTASTTIVDADPVAGYQIWGDVLIQWGQVTATGATQAVTLPTAFKNSSYIVTGTVLEGTNDTKMVKTDTYTTTGFNIRLVTETDSQAATGVGTWCAIGEAPDVAKQAKTIVGDSGQIQSEETASHVASEDDFAGNRVIKMNNASAITYTINSGLTNIEPLTLIQTGAGQLEIVAGASVTINAPDGFLKTRTQYSSVTIIPDTVAANTYYVVGDTVA